MTDRLKILELELRKQRKAWEAVKRIGLDGPIVDFAENRIRDIDTALAEVGAERVGPPSERAA